MEIRHKMSHKRNWSLSAAVDAILLDSERANAATANEDIEEQFIAQISTPISFNRRLSNYKSSSAPKTIPKSSAFKMFLQSPSASHSFPQPHFSMGISPSEKEVLSNHLLEERYDSQPFGSISHSLLGGETTREIYHWKEKQNEALGSRKRSNSEPNLVLIDENEESLVYASELRKPGVFRRFFMASKAVRYVFW